MWNQSTSAEGRVRLDNEERENWVNNDECLYMAYIASGQTIEAFIKANRNYIDSHIRAALRGGRA